MIEFLSGFIAVIVAFIAGMMCAPVRKAKPIEEQWIGEPPPWPLGIEAKPPATIVIDHTTQKQIRLLNDRLENVESAKE
jgi:hypothetical protein